MPLPSRFSRRLSPSRPGRPALLLVGAVLMGLASGCAEDVDVTVASNRTFTFYGYLDPTADQQAIRVVPITSTLDADSSGIDAVVTSTDLTSGTVTTWRDSLVTFADGTLGHVFLGAMTPTPGGRVRFEATRSDGASSRAEVDVPPLLAPVLGEAESTLNDLIYPITLAGAPRVLGGQLVLLAEDATLPPGSGTPIRISVPTPGISVTEQPAGSGVWTVRIPFVTAVRAALGATGQIGRVRLRQARFEAFVANREWVVPPGGPDVLVEPGTFTNVTGGFGFVGAGYMAPVTWTPSLATQARAGLAVQGEPALQLALNEVGLGASPFVELYNPTSEPISVQGYRLTDDQNQPDRFIIPANAATVPARGFLALTVPFPIAPGTVVSLLSTGQALVKSIEVGSAAGSAFGRFPDGFSQRLPQGGPDIFLGATTGTPGAPNRLPFRSPVVINEIYTAGEAGFVEVVLDPASSYTLDGSVQLSSDFARVAFTTPTEVSGSRGVRDESRAGTPDPFDLVLPQEGGAVFLYATAQAPGGATVTRVLDYRTYGPQDPSFATGYLPDGPSGEWRGGIVPSRGAANGGGLARR